MPLGRTDEDDVTLEEHPPEATSVKKVVVVVALLVTGVALVALVLFSGGGAASDGGRRPEEQPGRAQASETRRGRSFLDRPLRDLESQKGKEDVRADTQKAGAQGYTNGYPDAQAYGAGDPYAYPASSYGEGSFGGAAVKEPTPEEQSYQKALGARLVVTSGRDTRGPDAGDGDGTRGKRFVGDARSAQEQDAQKQDAQEDSGPAEMRAYFDAYKDAFGGAGSFGGGGSGSSSAQEERSAGPGGITGGSQEGRSFGERITEASEGGTYIAARKQQPRSPYEIKAGSVIPAVLMTGINSELPGDVVAQVSRDVYDRQQRYVLIPKGSRLIGAYDDQVALGQSRALVAWTRIIFPDGSSIQLPGLDAKGLTGETGLHDQVNRHFWRTFGTAIMLSAVGAGFQLSQPQQSAGGVFGRSRRSPQEVVAAEMGRELSRVATEILRQNIRRQPTIKIRQGFRFYVFLNRDLAFKEPYRESRSVPRFQRPNF